MTDTTFKSSFPRKNVTPNHDTGRESIFGHCRQPSDLGGTNTHFHPSVCSTVAIPSQRTATGSVPAPASTCVANCTGLTDGPRSVHPLSVQSAQPLHVAVRGRAPRNLQPAHGVGACLCLGLQRLPASSGIPLVPQTTVHRLSSAARCPLPGQQPSVRTRRNGAWRGSWCIGCPQSLRYVAFEYPTTFGADVD